MNGPNREEQRRLVKQWETTGPKLEQLRRESLRDKPYDWREVDALLQLSAAAARANNRTTSGLVEMQKIFRKAAPKK